MELPGVFGDVLLRFVVVGCFSLHRKMASGARMSGALVDLRLYLTL